MIHVRHRLASGDLSRCFEYDPARRAIILLVDGKGADIPVATESNPRHGAYSIQRIDETSWRLVPSVFEKRGAFWSSHIADYPNAEIPKETLQLTGTPANVVAEMGELFFEPCPEPDPDE